MSKNKPALLMFVRIAIIVVILVSCCTYIVLGRDAQISVVKVQFSNDSEINIFTTKTKIADILEEANIVLEPDETVIPGLEDSLTPDKKITICKSSDVVQTVAEDQPEVSTQSLQQAYANIVEKIETVQEKIPFETIRKDAVGTSEKATNMILQKGQDGLKETTYKVKYKNDVEVSREEISEIILKNPVNQIVQVISNKITSRDSAPRTGNISGNSLAAQVIGKTPKVVTMNTSAYTNSTCGKSPSSSGYGVTASGKKTAAWCTIAAGKGYKIGTIVYIPYFANKPNGGWFIVEDRGGAISNNRIDVYMSTYNECIQFGRQNLTCYVYE
ncbi:MAG: G5 domain-containing protein [Oscillospiraceae bacterium]|nr:G5 domain-containing protein [Oscillospiraceae bacterium]